jgi:hypothetical protein
MEELLMEFKWMPTSSSQSPNSVYSMAQTLFGKALLNPLIVHK